MFPMIVAMVMAAAAAPSAAAPDQASRWLLYPDAQHPLMAYVANEGGDQLQLDCTQTCKYRLVLAKPCIEGVVTPAIANGEAKDVPIVFTCRRDGEWMVLDMDGPDLGELFAGDQLAFAMSSPDELINVKRFSLAGAKEAIAAVKAQAAH